MTRVCGGCFLLLLCISGKLHPLSEHQAHVPAPGLLRGKQQNVSFHQHICHNSHLRVMELFPLVIPSQPDVCEHRPGAGQLRRDP